jgi:hypothetical protein
MNNNNKRRLGMEKEERCEEAERREKLSRAPLNSMRTPNLNSGRVAFDKIFVSTWGSCFRANFDVNIWKAT